MRSVFRFAFVTAACSALAACEIAGLLGLREHDVPSVILYDNHGNTSPITAPDTVARGVPFNIAFRTLGGGCTRKVARDDIAIDGNTVRVSPFDRSSGRDSCDTYLMILEHSVQLRLDVAGPWVIRVLGELRSFSSGPVNAPAELTYTVFVR